MSDGVSSTEPASEDWPIQAANTIENLVGQVRDKTAGPALNISRMVVLGLIAAIVGLAVLVILCILLVRIINVYLPEQIWGAYLVLGLIFCAGGLLLWSKRS